MYQVYLVKPNGNTPWLKPFDNLAECRMAVKCLDQLCTLGGLPDNVKFYNENTEVQAHDLETGRIYDYHDQDPSGHSDGIWS